MVVLSSEEIRQITGKHRYRAQAMVLARMGIPCVMRPDGRPMVSRLGFENALGNDAHQIEVQPNFEALDATQTKH